MRTKIFLSKFAVAITMLVLLTVSCSNDDEMDKCTFIYTNANGVTTSINGYHPGSEVLKSRIFSMFPNPAQDRTNLHFYMEGLNVITITNKRGITVFKESFDFPEEDSIVSIDIN